MEIDEFVEPHPYKDHVLTDAAVRAGWMRRNYMHHLAGIPYGGDSLDILCSQGAIAQFGLKAGRYVTVHNGFDPDFVVTGQRATKCYPNFGRVVTLMRAARPDLLFVQVGTVTSDPIPECDVDLISATSLPEVAELLKGALLHLDNEGGLVHLATCLGTRSVVVFGPTPSEYFGYPTNINIDPSFCGKCWWTTRSWMDHCAKGYTETRCMTEQPPENVARQALAAIAPELKPLQITARAEIPLRDAISTLVHTIPSTARTQPCYIPVDLVVSASKPTLI